MDSPTEPPQNEQAAPAAEPAAAEPAAEPAAAEPAAAEPAAAEPAPPEELTPVQHKDQGNQFYKAKNFPEAIECYTRAINAAPDVVTFYSNRSAAWQASGSLSECLADCVRAVQRDPAFAKCIHRGLKVAGSLGKLEQAVDFAEKLVAIEPDQAPVLESSQQNVQRFAAACEALEKNDFGGCMEALAEIEDSGVRFRDLILKQAECCLGLGNGSQTQRLTLQLIRENADDVDAYTLRGMALYLCDNVDQAVHHFKEALRRDPEHKKAMKQLKTVRGLQRLHQGIKDDMFKRDFGEAASKLTDALELDLLFGMRFQFIMDRAVCYLRTFQDDLCIADCETALELQPDTVAVIKTLITAYMHKQDYDKAVEVAEKFVEIEHSEESVKRLNEVKFEQKKALRPDYYAMLEITKIASCKEIKEGYHKQALELHPDKHPEDREAAAEKFKVMQVAYEVLSNDQMKKLYDEGYDYESIQEQIQRRGGGGG
jgi:tetratricopeptide (TPR) repeat protein